MLKPLSLGIVLAVLGAVGCAQAQGIKRTVLQKFDVPAANYETVIGMAEVAPNASIGRHMHNGVEAGYVAEGELVLTVEGQPNKTLKAGDSYQMAPETVHDGKAGAQGAKVIATYVVEKGKPLTTPKP